MTAQHSLPVPGSVHGAYPERKRPDASLLAQLSNCLDCFEVGAATRQRQWLGAMRSLSLQLHGLSAAALQQEVRAARKCLSSEGFNTDALARALACTVEAARRALGQTPFDAQLLTAHAMLHGRAVEMHTGEGKTLATGLAAATAAMAGIPVHCVTANDYLVQRDAALLQSVYALLGLSVATVTTQSTPAERRMAYRADITYCTAKELVFDYLRDRTQGGRQRDDAHRRAQHLIQSNGNEQEPLLRGLCMAIVDEADSVLIDEARTPLILSRSTTPTAPLEFSQQAFAFARDLRRDIDFTLIERQAALTVQGRQRLERWSLGAGPFWQSQRRAREIVLNALSAIYLYQRDRHYLVQQGKIQVIDETTGRTMPDRSWSRGVQQLLECKEGCAPTDETVPIAQITFQRFFPRYLMLAGTSGTLYEARAELRQVYALRLRKIAPRRASRRVMNPPRIYADAAEKWQQVVERAAAIHASGQPLLIGTDSVADSEALSALLHVRALPHRILNARQDREEAAIIARAGQRGAITVATNMAGRGTDIRLGKGCAALGGLHIIRCQLNSSRRIDRQLHGRCARQGDPGSVDTILSLDERLLESWLPQRCARAIRIMNAAKRPLPTWIARILIGTCQWLEERRGRVLRGQLVAHDRALESHLSVGGPGE